MIDHFVPIFSVCMTLHCSKSFDFEKGAMVLQNYILHLAEISENERDKLIKKNMVRSLKFLRQNLVNSFKLVSVYGYFLLCGITE